MSPPPSLLWVSPTQPRSESAPSASHLSAATGDLRATVLAEKAEKQRGFSQETCVLGGGSKERIRGGQSVRPNLENLNRHVSRVFLCTRDATVVDQGLCPRFCSPLAPGSSSVPRRISTQCLPVVSTTGLTQRGGGEDAGAASQGACHVTCVSSVTISGNFSLISRLSRQEPSARPSSGSTRGGQGGERRASPLAVRAPHKQTNFFCSHTSSPSLLCVYDVNFCEQLFQVLPFCRKSGFWASIVVLYPGLSPLSLAPYVSPFYQWQTLHSHWLKIVRWTLQRVPFGCPRSDLNPNYEQQSTDLWVSRRLP